MPTFNRLRANRVNGASVRAWGEFLSSTDLVALLDTPAKPEHTPDGVIYETVAHPELPGDFAMVDMSGLKMDTPHLHANEETEAHFALLGTARMVVGDRIYELKAGDSVIVRPGTPHYIMPGSEYV